MDRRRDLAGATSEMTRHGLEVIAGLTLWCAVAVVFAVHYSQGEVDALFERPLVYALAGGTVLGLVLVFFGFIDAASAAFRASEYDRHKDNHS